MDEQRIPNQAANQEPAKGSRETVDAGNERSSDTRDRFGVSDPQSKRRDDQAGGITNRPLDEEIASQRELPPRGEVKVPERDHASEGNDRRDAPDPRDYGVLRRPGDPTRDSISTTQTNSGLASGDPAGGPHRTPERRDLDESQGRQPQAKSGRDPDLRPREPDRVQAPDDVNATPPHGDELLERKP